MTKREKNKIMKRIISLAVLTVAFQFVGAQENLVPNPSFEEVSGKVKEAGAIGLAAPWKSVTMNPVDLYTENAKNDEYATPKNVYGEEKANTGVNYAGLSFFGYNGRMPRSYIGVGLNKKLEAGVSYCMKFHVSMSDMSKYAVNNIGMYISAEELTEKTDGKLSYKPQVKSLKNEAFDKQFLWTAICGIYKAEGGESFITIGNFDEDADTEQKKVRLSREFMGNRQQNNAYYFIDDVSVVALTEKTMDDCLCDKIAGGRMQTEFKSFGTDKSMRTSAKKTYLVNSDGTKAGEGTKTESNEFSIESAELYYADKAFEPKASSAETLERVASYLKDNQGVKLMIIGHIDESESSVNLLAKKRAFTVRKALQAMGVSDDQLSHSSKEATEPSSSGELERNRRVTFRAE